MQPTTAPNLNLFFFRSEMQHSNQLKPVPTSDVVRLHFFLWRVLTIRDFLKAIDIEIALLRAEVCHDNSWRFWRSRWGAIIWTFTGLFMIGRHMIDCTESCCFCGSFFG
jgi:hypothetical protein